MNDQYHLPEILEDEVAYLEVKGAREHNLKNISVSIPRNKLVVITGLSGSGKSSLAFDTIYAEGQRRYMESLSNYARQFIGNLERPDVELISGLSPVISIEQKTTNRNPRSTVGTTTELYDFLRLLFARLGEPHSYNTGEKMVKYSEDQIIHQVLEQFNNKKIAVLAPLVRGRKGHYRELFEDMRKKGYLKVRVDGDIVDLTPKMQVDRYKIHDIELVVDRLKVHTEDLQRIRQSVQTGLNIGKGLIFILDLDTNQLHIYSKTLMCPTTGISYEEPSPNSFSFNSPYGACPHCKGLGTVKEADLQKIIPDYSKSIKEGGLVPLGPYKENQTFRVIKQLVKSLGGDLDAPLSALSKDLINTLLYGNEGQAVAVDMDYGKKTSYHLSYEGIARQIERSYNEPHSEALRNWAANYVSDVPCRECGGFRLKRESLHFLINNLHIGQVSKMDISYLAEWIDGLTDYFQGSSAIVARDIIKELKERTQFLLDVGLGYLSLDRPTSTLSGGESQRIRLASQIGSLLMGITYILDEPSIGLHQRDNHRLIEALKRLRDLGNTVLVVEHDKDIMLASDYIIDLGPGAGKHGGQVVAEGPPNDFLSTHSLTARYLSNKTRIEVPASRRKGNGYFLELLGATGHNLRDVHLRIPLGTLTCITGVSGSGKSTLINETLYPVLNQHLYRSPFNPLPYKSVAGLEHIDKVIEIDQAPIGRTPRSNPATYTGVFDPIRALYASTPEAQIRGYKQGRFSFNVKGGRCEECGGGGLKVIEMNFLPDVYVQCPKCLGKRYNRETLEVKYKGKSIYDVLEMTIEEATVFFEHLPQIHRKLKTLLDVGLGYVTLGQPATTLSGGEAQRVKLAEELSKRDTGKTIYILDEPTTGLHFEDIRVLLGVIQKLVEKGNTVVIIEHNLDVVKVSDYVVDIGPEGGRDGGNIVAQGTPEEVAACENSITGKFLKLELS
jgi:excinuclease ABC subunit A